jgi:hypothetical protein
VLVPISGYRRKNTNYQVGLGVQQSQLKSLSYQAAIGKDSLTINDAVNFFPQASFNYTPSRTKNFRVNYRGRTNQPTVSQLQNVRDNSDFTNQKIGNPDLDQEFTHTFGSNFNTFNMQKFRFIAFGVNLSVTDNKIVNSIDYVPSNPLIQNSPQITLTKPVNMDGNYSGFSYLTFGFPFKSKKLKGSSLNFNTNFAYNHDVSLIDEEKNLGKTMVLGQSAGINFNIAEKFDFGANLNVSYNNIHYSISEEQNEDYFHSDLFGGYDLPV